MSRSNVLPVLHLGFRAWKMLAIALLYFCATSAFAQASTPQAVWDSYGCSGCHAAPPQLSPGDSRSTGQTTWNVQLLNDFAAGTAISGGSACTAVAFPDVADRFRCWFQQQPLTRAGQTTPGSGAMYSLAHSANPNELRAMGQYVLDLRQGSATPASLDFGNLALGSSSTPQTVTVANSRFANITYQLTPTPTGDFAIGNQSCSGGVVAGTTTLTASTCTIDITFNPTTATGPASQTSTLTIALATQSGGDPTPGTVSYDTTLAAFTTKPIQISLHGTGFSAPTASIAALPTAAATGSTLSLSGSGTDPNPSGVISSYAWHITKDGTAFTDLTGATNSFQATSHGTYVVRLIVSDQYTASSPVTRTVVVVDRPTAAIAKTPATGPNYIGNTITFDGSASTRQTGDSLTYAWSISPAPGGSAFQVGSTPSTATFTPPDGQTYVVSLDVDDQGVHTAVAATSTVTAVAPPPPHADAGVSRPALVGTVVALDGTHSTSGNGHAVTCAWTVVRHADSAAQTVTNANACSASFTPTVTGDFDVTLTVGDGYSSAMASITITSSDGSVTVSAGSDQSVILGATAALSGSATSGIADPLTYAWTLTSTPTGSLAAIANPGSATAASLTPDLPGAYIVRLTATDQHGHSNFASAKITVKPPLTSTPSLSFAASLGSSSTASATVQNNTSAPVTLQSISFGGATPADYAVDASSGCSVGAPIAQATFCTLVVRFTPTVVGARNASASLAYPLDGSPLDITLLGTATPMPQGVLSSTSWSQAFDDTVIGTTSGKSVTLSNTSTGASAAPVVFSSFTLNGTASADYQLGGTCSTSTPLAPQATCTLAFTFAPSATGARAASLQVASNASNPLVSIGLTGNGLPAPAPALTVAPSTLSFGTQTVGGAYPAQAATLTNTGTAPLAISTVTIAGTGFSIADASACAGATLAVNASCRLSVNFNPAAAQPGLTGTVTIASNVQGSPTLLGLVGTGTAAAAPVLAWSPATSTLDFGTVQAGAISATQSLILSNQGPGGASLSFFNAVGTGSSAFTIGQGSCPTTQPLFAGTSCRLDIVFAPSVSGAKSATLQVVSNGSVPAPVALTGTGLAGPALALALSTSAIDFGAVQLGTRSQPAALRLSNSGSGTLQVSAIGATGAFSVQGASCPAAPFTLPSGAECTVAVTFQPTSSGAVAGMLSVQSDAQAQSGDVALAGKGENAPDLSSGGCSLSRGGGAFDPTLWCLGVFALVALAYRARQRRQDARRDRETAP